MIEALSGNESAMVVNLYRDEISGLDVDWGQLVADIFNAERIISWW